MGALKLILSFVIVVSHTSPILGLSSIGSIMAVEVFFIISGFLTAFVLTEKYTKVGDTKRYIISRLKSIYPAYWLVLAITVVFCIIAWNTNAEVRLREFFVYPLSISQYLYLIFTNIFLLGQDTLFFLSLSGNSFAYVNDTLGQPIPAYKYILVPQAWYLALQVLFYLIAPFLVKIKSLKNLIVMILVIFLARYFAYAFGYDHSPWIYRFWFFEFAYFILGFVAYKFYTYVRTQQISINLHRVVFVLIIGITVFYEFLPLNFYPDLKQWIFYLLLSASLPSLFILFKESTLDRYLSKLSYGVYLVHILFADIFAHFIISHQYVGIFIALLSVVAVILFDWLILPGTKIIIGRVYKLVHKKYAGVIIEKREALILSVKTVYRKILRH